MTATGLTLRRSGQARSSWIDGADILITDDAEGWKALACSRPAQDWLAAAGLDTVRFSRRADLLAAVAAHAAVLPLPSTDVPDGVRLRRRPDGAHVTDTGDYEVRPARRPGLRWEIMRCRPGQPPRPASRTRTLTLAAEEINRLRLIDHGTIRP